MALHASVVRDVLAHARADAPDECCGLLVGTPALVHEAVHTRSVERGPDRYQVDPAEHIALLKLLRGSDRAIVGAYHSHPLGEAVPSASDLREAYYPEFVYLIVAPLAREAQVRAWRITDGAATELATEIVP